MGVSGFVVPIPTLDIVLIPAVVLAKYPSPPPLPPPPETAAH